MRVDQQIHTHQVYMRSLFTVGSVSEHPLKHRCDEAGCRRPVRILGRYILTHWNTSIGTVGVKYVPG